MIDPEHPDHIPGYESAVLAAPIGPPPGDPTTVTTPGATALHRAAMLARETWIWFAAGLPLSREASRRLAICEACSHFTPSRQCDLCTCYMDLKARLATSHCPIDKW